MLTCLGTLTTSLSIEALVERLRNSEAEAEIRESSHFTEGRYIKLGDAVVHFTLERTGSNEFIARGDAESQDELSKFCQRLALALQAHGVNHVLELYREDDQLLQVIAHSEA